MKKFFVSSQKRFLFLYPVLALFIGVLSGCKMSLIPGTEEGQNRYAATVEQDHLGDSYKEIKYLDQGWKSEDSLWFYNITQGSNLMPYDFFLVLEKPGESQLFRSDKNMNFYRYLPQKASSENPDALPVGWVKDIYKGKEYVGLTCAACHTGQINYNGVGIRIDGGPASADMENIMINLAKALQHTRENAEAKQRFVKNVLAKGNYKSEADVLADLSKYEQRIYSYTYINASQTSYGYARLDAFGRIYNRVLEHVLNEKELRELLRDRKVRFDKELTKAQIEEISKLDKAMTEKEIDEILSKVDKVITGEQRDHLVERLRMHLTPLQIALLNDAVFNRPDAPVSYPFLWDIAQHDYVQWNGIANNAGLGPIGRNAGEVIGVFGTLDWQEEKGISLPSLLFQSSGNTRVRFDSSVDVQNLHRIESHLKKLNSPVWPQEILGDIDREKAAKGEILFAEYCAACHAAVDRVDPNRRIIANMTRVSDVGTDSTMAENSFVYQGYSGILRNQYVSLEVGNLLLDKKAPVAALLTQATKNVVATPDPDKLFFQRWTDWAVNLVTAYTENEIKSSIKNGNYDPDTTVNPLASLNAYKGRPLNGIWATAPYLHNGSVPTLYDLLLPKKREGDPDDGEYRPDQFEVGSREFDPVNVGLKSSGYQGFTFKTKDSDGKEIRSNSNAGHEYASGKTAQPNGEILEALSKEEKLDLLEYLKTL